MENTNEKREKKAENFKQKQNMVIESTVDDLIKELKEKGEQKNTLCLIFLSFKPYGV